MNNNSSGSIAVGIFESHDLAENAVRELQRSGLEMSRLSIAARDQYTDEHVVGYYNAGDRMMYWGRLGAFWGTLWGILLGAGVFIIPGIGPLLVAGPLVGTIAAGLQGAVLVGGLSAVGAALCSIGVPRDSVIAYETAIKNGKFILLYHGNATEVGKARALLAAAKSTEVAWHETGLVYV
jgi:hypothetical protein